MGFLDKAKANLEKVAKQGQEKVDEVQAKRKAEGLLRDLGAWTYASHTGRDEGKGPAEVQRIIGQLQAHEAEHGPLGGDKDDEDGDATAAAGPPGGEAHAVPTTPPPAPAGVTPPPPPMSDQGTPAGAAPPPPAATVMPPAAEPKDPEGGFTVDDL